MKSWLFFILGLSGWYTCTYSYWIPFHPMSPRELHPESLRLCKNCAEARSYEDNPQQHLVCKLFGNINPVNGNVQYHSCTVTRANASHCGPEGRYYHHVYSSM